ncbi:MAG: putative glycoside hydrolase [Pseudomonadales bacterium]
MNLFADARHLAALLLVAAVRVVGSQHLAALFLAAGVRVAAIVAIIGGLAVTSVGAVAQSKDRSIMAGAAATAPFRFYLGDESNWSVLVGGSWGETDFGELRLDSVASEGKDSARQITWSGEGKRDSQFYLLAGQAQDYSDFGKDAAISMIVKVDQKPKGLVKQRMDCGWPCYGELDMTRLFAKVPTGQWFRASVPLECFADAGANLKQVRAPLLLMTDEPFQLTLSQVAIIESPPPATVIGCK